jgi:hypothetical protein
MQAESMTEGSAWINVDEIGTALGLPSHESRQLTNYLEDRGWALVNQATPGRVSLRLTSQGREEIRKLHWSWPRRWFYKNWGSAISITIATAALAVSILSYLKSDRLTGRIEKPPIRQTEALSAPPRP